MAACGSLQHIFENPLPEHTTLLESLSTWKQVNPLNDPLPFTEIFGELHFKESPQFHTDFTRKRSESLQLCTEGLGFESSDDHIEDLKNKFEQDELMKNLEEGQQDEQEQEQEQEEEKAAYTAETCNNFRRSRISTVSASFPPPISCIGKSGRPWVSFKAYRDSGRFVLKEVRIPTQEFLHACREDGRLKLQFVQPEDDTIYEEDETEDEEFEDNSNENIDERGEEKVKVAVERFQDLKETGNLEICSKINELQRTDM